MTIYLTLALLACAVIGLLVWPTARKQAGEANAPRKVLIYTGVERRARRRYEPVF